MFGDAFRKSRLQKQLFLLNAVTGFVSAASEASALDRCPDYVAKHGELYPNSLSTNSHEILQRL